MAKPGKTAMPGMTPDDVRLLVQRMIAEGMSGIEQRIEGLLASLPKPGELPPSTPRGSGITTVAGRSIMPLMVRWRQEADVTKYDVNLVSGTSVVFQNGVAIPVDLAELTQLGTTPWYNLTTCDGADDVTDLYAVAIPDVGGISTAGWQVNPDSFVKVRFYTNITLAALSAAQQAGIPYGLRIHLAKVTARSIVWQAFDGEKNGVACMGDGDRNGVSSTQDVLGSSIVQVATGIHQLVNLGMTPDNNDPTKPMVIADTVGGHPVTKLMAQPNSSSDAPPTDPSTVETFRHDDPALEGNDTNNIEWKALGGTNKGLLWYIPVGPPVYKPSGDAVIYQYCRMLRLTNNGRAYSVSTENTRITVATPVFI